jgi:hypothetical protein
MAHHQDRYIPADTNGGWPIAAGVVVLAILFAVGASMVYSKTYKHPTDITWQAPAAKSAAH